MQSVLVKQHVLDALSIIEEKQRSNDSNKQHPQKKAFVSKQGPIGQKKKESSESSFTSESETSSEDEDDEDESDSNSDSSYGQKRSRRPIQTEDDLVFESGGFNEEQKVLDLVSASNDDYELLLDNYYVRVNPDGSRTKVPKAKTSIADMQEQYALKKSLEEYEA